MKYFDSYIQTAEIILNNYKGVQPFHQYIKKHFSENKKFGARDRKWITEICYCHFRLGQAFTTLDFKERIKIGIYLCAEEITQWDFFFDTGWVENWSNDLIKKIHFIDSIYGQEKHLFFPFAEALSDNISFEKFNISHLIKPAIFFRVRPNYLSTIKSRLDTHKVQYISHTPNSYQVEKHLDLTTLFNINKEIVIQDFSSQKITNLFEKINFPKNKPIAVWDACAASGGKTILIKDYFEKAEITVSDNRPHILKKLEQRMQEAAIEIKNKYCFDLSTPQQLKEKFDIIILDVPCSGSGTFGRIPEQLLYFQDSALEKYVQLQQKIILNIKNHLKTGGYLLYITCSVFKSENENQVQFIQKHLGFRLIQSNIYDGYMNKADTMFGAVFFNC